jgi:RNA 2',3'-cyclic 3'-phosphodiesterase
MEEKLRAFIAIEFPDEVIKEIARLQELLRNKKFTGKFTELENLHLTLKFLGELDSETLGKVRKALAAIKFEEFSTYLEYAGTFNHLGSPRIVWIKLGGAGILKLQKQIDSALKDIFKPEERFMSHLTLARVRHVNDQQDFIDYVKPLSIQKINFPIKEFQLKKSDLKPMGPVYTTIETYSSLDNKIL